MAPEILNSVKYDTKADVWSLGTLFYEMLFGKPPFTASSIVDLIENIKSSPIDFNKNINKISKVIFF